MYLDSLHNLFVDQLKDLYSAENQLVEALPKMVEAASSSELREAFEHHLEQTREHVHRLDQVFIELGEDAYGEVCEAMEGLVEEGSEAIEARGNPTVKDAALIAAAQRVEHYEIAGYGTVRTYAHELGYNDAANLLQRTLDEEGEADKKLTKIAEGSFLSSGINQAAR